MANEIIPQGDQIKKENEMTDKNNSKAIEKVETGIIELTRETVRQYICPNATFSEVDQFIHLAKIWNLDPWKRQIHLVKYGNNPAQIVVGYESYIRRASESGKLIGWEVKTEGSVKEPANFKAAITIHIKGWAFPFYHEVFYDEYVQHTKEGKVTKFWAGKPRTMLKKVAISQGFRLAFPEEVGGMPYTQEEIMENPEYIEHTPIRQGAKLADKIVEQGEIKTVETKEPVKKRKNRKSESTMDDVGPAEKPKTAPKPKPQPKPEPEPETEDEEEDVIDAEPIEEEAEEEEAEEDEGMIEQLFTELETRFGRDRGELLAAIHSRLEKKYKLKGNINLERDLNAEQMAYIISSLEKTVENEKLKLKQKAAEVNSQPELPEEEG